MNVFIEDSSKEWDIIYKSCDKRRYSASRLMNVLRSSFWQKNNIFVARNVSSERCLDK